MLECKNLRKVYKSKCVVNDLSFQVKKGEVFALLGSNGAGKTTTIKMMLGLVRKNDGEILVEDGITIGYSPETPYFPPFLTGIETLSYYAKIQKINKRYVNHEVENLLEKVGLENDKTKIKNYSKGMLQRLALAQALLGNPQLLILDEPTAGLDAIGRLEMLKNIGELKAQGKTIILNSHILNDIEKVCDRGIIISKGQLIRTWNKELETGNQTLEELFIEAIGGAK